MSSDQRRARFKMIGIVVLVTGIVGALALYWARTRSDDSADAMVNQYDEATERAQSRQMGILYGKMGQDIESLIDDLKNPGPQSFIIGAVSSLAALGFFSAARPPREDEAKDPSV